MGGGASHSRQAFFDVGLAILSDLGYGGLKQAEVCKRLEVTTGSFYHYFSSWAAYTEQLVAHWREGMTTAVVEAVGAEPDPRKRLDSLVQTGLALPHGAEAAIRVWSAVDPQVRAVQAAVDSQRFATVYECALPILQDERRAELFASWAMYLLVGYEQVTLPPDTDGLACIFAQLLDALDTGRFGLAAAGE